MIGRDSITISVDAFTAEHSLTGSERREVIAMLLGLAAKDSALVLGLGAFGLEREVAG